MPGQSGPVRLEWKRFCAACREGQTPCTLEVRTRLNRFRARYELARRFTGVSAENYSARALRGYSSGIRLLLAYTAAEGLGVAIDYPVKKWKLEDNGLEAPLRAVLRRAGAEGETVFSHPGLRKQLDNFIVGNNGASVLPLPPCESWWRMAASLQQVQIR